MSPARSWIAGDHEDDDELVPSPAYRFLLVTWEGGGNVAVMLGIGVALARRGHVVTLAAPLSVRESTDQLGLGFTAFGARAPSDARQRSGYLIDVADGASQEQLPGVLAAVRPDVLVIDCNLAWALAERLDHRTAVVVHTAPGLYLPAWQQVLDAVNIRRAAAGRPVLPPAAIGWAAADRLLIMSLSARPRRRTHPGIDHHHQSDERSAPRPVPFGCGAGRLGRRAGEYGRRRGACPRQIDERAVHGHPTRRPARDNR